MVNEKILKKFNIFAGVIHGIIALVVVQYLISNDSDKGKRKWSTNKPQGPYFDIKSGNDYSDQDTNSIINNGEPFLNYRYFGKAINYHQWGIFLFEAITSLFHFFAYAYNKKYFERLNKDKNPYRWIEYSITSTLMIGCLRMLTSCTDLQSGINVLGASVATNLLALANEYVTDPFAGKLIFFCSSISFVTGWYQLLRHFNNAIEYTKQDGQEEYEVKSWEKFAVWGTFTAYLSFPVIFYQQKFGNLNYYTAELYYVIASLFSKVYLSLFVHVGERIAES